VENSSSNMTIWDRIYQKYKQDGEEYATLKPGLIPDFLNFIKEHDFRAKRVLDIGCGNGKYLAFLQSLGLEVSGLDSSPTAVEMANSLLNDSTVVIEADIYGYLLPASTYDLIISIAAIHHGLKSQVINAIKNIYQSLKTGGYCFITLPDNEGSSHWVSMAEHQEIEPGTRIPLTGPEKGLPHSSFTKKEIEAMFVDFSKVTTKLLSDRGRWIIIAQK